MMIWKFLFWPLIWTMILLPGWIWPLYLEGPIRTAVFFLGLILFADAIVLTAVAGRTLRYFAHKGSRKTFWPDKFTAVGIYGCMRHPMHLGLALLPAAITFMWGSVPAILAAGWGVAAALWFVLTIEEKETLQYFGNTYSHYMQHTPPFNLSPKCLIEGYVTLKQKEQEHQQV
jgi:protein-S-isoprenylcysteine O-methyltransferase Ste14